MKRFGLVAAALALALLLAPATALAAGGEGIAYTALGDSIAVGTGGTGSVGYVRLLADHLGQTHGGVTLVELSDEGMTSEGLLAVVGNPANAPALMQADVITVSIGGNDILQPALGFVGGPPLYGNPENLKLLTPQQKADLLVALHAVVYPEFVQFTSNWPLAMGAINTLKKSTAEVYVNTLYNPFKPGDGLYEIVDPYVALMNKAIVDASPYADYHVVDVYSAFGGYGNPRKPLVHGLASPYAIHPTDRGYKLIYNLHKDAMSQ